MTLLAADLELSAHGCTDWIDLARVGLSWHPMVATHAFRGHGEGTEAEVTRFETGDDVVAAELGPVLDILIGDQDRARSLRTTGAAAEAVQGGRGL